MTRLSPTLIFSVAITLVSPTDRTLEAQDSETKAPEPLLKNLSADHRTLLVIEDPVPWLESILSDKGLEKVLEKGAFAEFAKSLPGGASINLATAREWVDEKKNFIPSRIAIGAPDASLRSIGKLVRFGFFTGYANAADAIEKDSETELARFQKEAVAALAAAEIPTITIWAEMRRGAEAAVALNILRLALGGLASQTGGTPKTDGAAFGIEFEISNFLPAEIASTVAVEFGLAKDAEDANAVAFGKALSSKIVRIWAEKVDSAIRLSIGAKPDAKAAGLSAKALAPLYGGTPAPLTWATWDLRTLRAELEPLSEEWERRKDTKLGARLREIDTEDMISTFELFALQVENAGTTGHLRAHRQESTVHAEMTAVGVKPGEALTGSPIVRAIPAHAQSFALSGTSSLADQLAGSLLQVEDRLGTQSFRATLGDDPSEEERWDKIVTNYYRDFGKFRRLVFDRAPQVFSAPSGWLVDFRGMIREARFTISKGGQKATSSLEKIPVPEVALFTRVQSTKEAKILLGKLWTEFGTGLLRSFEDSTTTVDVAFDDSFEEAFGGAPESSGPKDAFGFSTAPLHAALGKNGYSVELETDSRLHGFFLDDVLVLSSSPRLSRQIVTSWNSGAEKRRQLPKSTAGRLTEYSEFTADSLASGMEKMFDGMVKFSAMTQSDSQLERGFGEELALLGKGLAEVLRLAEGLRVTSHEKDSARTTRLALELKKSTF